MPYAALQRLLLTHPDASIRQCALLALDVRCPSATLAAALCDPDPLVRRCADDLVSERPSAPTSTPYSGV